MKVNKGLNSVKNKASIIIANYNYADFLIETLQSAVNQTYPNTEIILVDDGSTDDSVTRVTNDFSAQIESGQIILVEKENGGQLSAFNAAVPHISGDYVFMLDSDDLYVEDHIEKTINKFQENKIIDFIFCAVDEFSENPSNVINARRRHDTNVLIGYSFFSALLSWEWLGDVTASLAMKADLYKSILPIKEKYLENDWRIRADDCLVWGASLLGATKYYYNDTKILYRIHGNNNFFKLEKKKLTNFETYDRTLKTHKLFNYFIKKYGIQNTRSYKWTLKNIVKEYRQRNDRSEKTKDIYHRCIREIEAPFFTEKRFLKKLSLKNR